jgi:hypothetical protein
MIVCMLTHVSYAGIISKLGRDLRQERLNRILGENAQKSDVKIESAFENKMESTRLIDIDTAEFKTHPLWNILVETARRSPLYPGLSGYCKSKILPDQPNISVKELARKLSISIGEALVLLHDLTQ